MKKLLMSVLAMAIIISVSFIIGRDSKEKQIEYKYKEVVKKHYLTDIHFDTIEFNHYDTVTLKRIDTINNVITDSVLVQLPINEYILDTVLTDTNSMTAIQAFLTGYDVNFDSLYIQTKIKATEPVYSSQKKWYDRIVPSIGVGFDTDLKFGIFIGVGYHF